MYRDSVIYQPKTLFKYSDHIIAIFVSKTYSIHLMANRIGGINGRACVWCDGVLYTVTERTEPWQNINAIYRYFYGCAVRKSSPKRGTNEWRKK